MTRQELRKKIAALRKAAKTLTEPAKTEKLVEANTLEMKIQGMGLDQVADIMSGIKKADLVALDAKIIAAQDATEAEQERIKMITETIGKIREFLGLE